jgi:Predicted oxidoreductases of the aldo/keto reductase family
MQKILFPGTDFEISRLGLGCMRLPMKGDEVDEAAAIALIRKAIDNGVNYIDTAYPYHNGVSELMVGKALEGGYREKVILATKLPVWKVNAYEDMEALLDEQLKKLKTDYVDFYLLHALGKERFHMLQKLNYKKFLDDMVKKGKIKYPAFSFHDNAEAFLEILNDYPWAMAQVQINILDMNAQATYKGVQAAHEKGIAVVVMEPLRGGSLARAPKEVQALYDAYPVKRTPVEWALRFLYDMPEVTVILSGMSNEEQLMQNIATFEDAQIGVMDANEKELISKVEKAYLSRIKTGCTGCEYCQPCPMEIKIPNIFKGYDRALMFDKMDEFYKRYEKCTDKCLECGACEAACPQHLPIIQYLKEIEAGA